MTNDGPSAYRDYPSGQYDQPISPGQHYAGSYPPPKSPTSWNPNVAPAPKKKNGLAKALVIAGIVLVFLCGGGLVACTAMAGKAVEEVDKEIKNGNTEKLQQVKLKSCTGDDFGVRIVYEVTNTSATVQSYWIQFEISDPSGNRLGEGHGVINNLAAGKTAKENTLATAGDYKGKFKCQVVKVN